MFRDIIQLSKNTLLIEGMIPRSILIEPDIANSVVHKNGDTLFLFDTGATLAMRRAIHAAIEKLRPFKRFVLLNSHGHPDHTGNNAIINEVEALEKRHYISEQGMSIMDFEKYFIEKYETIGRYYHYLDGPRFPVSIFAKTMKFLSTMNSSLEYVMLKKSLNKFRPFDTSPETAEAFEATPARKLTDTLKGWNGWHMHDSLYALESRGHSPDSISFYIPEEKILLLADEAFLFFNCWPDSNSKRIEETLRRSIEMVKCGNVETLITGHDHEIFTGKEIITHIETLLSDNSFFRQTVLDIVREHQGGITVHTIYSRLRSQKSQAVLKKYFSIEFPKMPPMLKTVITSLLLEEGCGFSGPEGKAVFYVK